MQAQGWRVDGFGIHEFRWYSGGNPTALVRDDGVEAFDAPPSGGAVGSAKNGPQAQPDPSAETDHQPAADTEPEPPAEPRPAGEPSPGQGTRRDWLELVGGVVETVTDWIP